MRAVDFFTAPALLLRRDPGAAMLLADLAMQAGLPKGARKDVCRLIRAANAPPAGRSRRDMVASSSPCPRCFSPSFEGVLNIVHGTHDVVNGICDHPDIRAVSFVGEFPQCACNRVKPRCAAAGVPGICHNLLRYHPPLISTRRRYLNVFNCFLFVLLRGECGRQARRRSSEQGREAHSDQHGAARHLLNAGLTRVVIMASRTCDRPVRSSKSVD